MAQAVNVATRTIRFHSYGEPAAVLRLEETDLPGPTEQRVRIKVQACDLNPADLALCGGYPPEAFLVASDWKLLASSSHW